MNPNKIDIRKIQDWQFCHYENISSTCRNHFAYAAKSRTEEFQLIPAWVRRRHKCA